MRIPSAGLLAIRRLLFVGGPAAVFFVVSFFALNSVYGRSMGPWFHVMKEIRKTLAPPRADGNAATAVTCKLCIVSICASLNHLSPTVMGGSQAQAKHRLTAH
jgi:hypothetical protein